ncbi:MAG TPA: peptidyl-dipeptidase Dcp [Gemmatimonadaceae bacterium]|jgi:peptidyl-dipeptidase Dcp|nr:peptidyl-dipeptidase Dcp [Gemmatimonadaceae bacterium]HZJ00763.1 peptidyl-dipeptidase Dcp [Gemmatimonadaceae bacterium]
MTRYRLLIIATAGAFSGCATTTQQPSTIATTTASPAPTTHNGESDGFTSANPFYAESALPFHAPPFDRIKESDYQPAIEAGMREQIAEMETIANQTSAPTFDNTIVPMERSGALLTRATKVFFALTSANTDSVLQRIQEIEAPKLAAHGDAIYLNPKLFQRVKSIYDARAKSNFTPEQNHLVELYYKNFVRAGAQLSEENKTKLRALNQEEAKLSTDFQNKLLAGTKAGALILDSKDQLDGLSENEIASAADAAKSRGLTGKWVLPLQNTTQQPAQASLKNRAIREKLFIASTTRTEHGDSSDTRATITRLAQLRADKAQLLGYPTYSAYSLENQMSGAPAQALKLLQGIVPAATAKARSEAAQMQALIDKQGGGFKLAPWDWQYYSEQVRKAQYDLDESQLKPYFELDNVLRNGVFFAANKLYGITFKERKDIPVYQPDVRVFEVTDSDGKPLALFYADYFKRDEKGGGAWMDSFVDQSGLMGTLPVVFNVANFTKPAPGQPALLTFNDVTTMFHEFGHALHGMFSKAQYPSVAGTNVPRDFVEFPSQFNEHWALDPTVFANYAKHYQTGAPMPAALVDKVKKAKTFNQGFATTEYLAASLLDIAWHQLPPGSPQQNVDAFEKDALKRFNIDMYEVPPRYRTSYFAHIWGGGYASSYYAYLWSELIDDDAYYWFKEHGGLTRENGQKFRDMILSRGGTQEVASLYRAFRGRDPSVDPLLEERGLKSTIPDTQSK